MKQLSFFDDEPPESPDRSRVVLPTSQKLGEVSSARSSYQEVLLLQIRRDTATLQEDSVYHAPSRKFYEERIKVFQEELRLLKRSRK